MRDCPRNGVDEISLQLSQALGVIEHHLKPTVLAVHLYGSALDGGLKPFSDIDLLVTVGTPIEAHVRQALLVDLLAVSSPPGQSAGRRALEVTVVVRDDVVPWRHPARRELQFGEWLRDDIERGVFEPASLDGDLAVLLTKARQHGLALVGPAPADLFDAVPEGDLFKALREALGLWRSPPDWLGDERNVVLTLARILYTATTGTIVSKDFAASWALERLPARHRPILFDALQAHLGQADGRLLSRREQLAAFVDFMKQASLKLLDASR